MLVLSKQQLLKSQIEQTQPDWHDKFLCYKKLKKQLKIMCRKDGQTPPQLDANELNNFLNLLQLEIDKFNTFFVDKEEEHVIKWKELQEKAARTMDSNEQLMSMRREIVDFHGEMVLLENYSALNYAALVKIIKKCDKKTGALLCSPFIQDVVNQPFFEIDVLNKLVKECEVMLSILFTNGTCSSIGEDFEADGFGTMNGYENKDTLVQVPEELAEIENLEKMFTQLTVSALHSLEEIRGRITWIFSCFYVQNGFFRL